MAETAQTTFERMKKQAQNNRVVAAVLAVAAILAVTAGMVKSIDTIRGTTLLTDVLAFLRPGSQTVQECLDEGQKSFLEDLEMLRRLSIIPLLFLAAPALADAHLNIDCTDLDVADENDVRTAFLCLTDYQQRLEQLESQIGKLIDANTNTPFVTGDHSHDNLQSVFAAADHSHFGVPSGAVIASLAACDTLGDGWSDFNEARGRMIVGAGDPNQGSDLDPDLRNRLSARSVYVLGSARPDARTLGGEEEVILLTRQMPSHSHGFGFWFSDKDGDDRLYDRNEAPRIRSGLNTDSRWTAQTDRTPIGPTGGNQPHNNMPPYIALYFCKKD